MVAGLLYIVSTIFGSMTYLSLTVTNMANDLWWANYNASREHVYVSRLYNMQLNAVAMTDSKFMDDANYTISASKVVSGAIKPYYVSRVLSTDASELATVIHGLRVMDASLAPWIASQYC
ncbi:hypothetical protein AC1031_022046 [Aphanomyces cochlioides]|nr:hypothetical protein AC1031_022046 [Aphanomyces cochlioides]